MTYPLTTKTYFADTKAAWRFAEYIGANLEHTIVSDFGTDLSRESEPHWVETINDPFSSKNDLLRLAGLIR